MIVCGDVDYFYISTTIIRFNTLIHNKERFAHSQ